MTVLQRFWLADDGATAIEYGLIAALIAVALITAAIFFGDNLTTLFGMVRDRATNAWDNVQL